MPRAIWKGSVSFGLVTIPVSLYPSGESAEKIAFRQLHRTDLAPIQYRRVCSAEGTEVPWGEIAKGYEYAKGQFVVVTDEDFAKARVEATQTIDVRDFVPAAYILLTRGAAGRKQAIPLGPFLALGSVIALFVA